MKQAQELAANWGMHPPLKSQICAIPQVSQNMLFTKQVHGLQPPIPTLMYNNKTKVIHPQDAFSNNHDQSIGQADVSGLLLPRHKYLVHQMEIKPHKPLSMKARPYNTKLKKDLIKRTKNAARPCEQAKYINRLGKTVGKDWVPSTERKARRTIAVDHEPSENTVDIRV